MRQIATLTIAAAAVAAIGLGLLPRPAAAALPCCSIQAVDTRTGIVTAIDRATGQSFHFQANPAQLQGLRPGQPVYGNAASGRVGLTQQSPCCTVVGRGAATGAAAPIGPVDAARTAAPVGPVDAARAPLPAGPVDARTAPHTLGGRR